LSTDITGGLADSALGGIAAAGGFGLHAVDPGDPGCQQGHADGAGRVADSDLEHDRAGADQHQHHLAEQERRERQEEVGVAAETGGHAADPGRGHRVDPGRDLGQHRPDGHLQRTRSHPAAHLREHDGHAHGRTHQQARAWQRHLTLHRSQHQRKSALETGLPPLAERERPERVGGPGREHLLATVLGRDLGRGHEQHLHPFGPEQHDQSGQHAGDRVRGGLARGDQVIHRPLLGQSAQHQRQVRGASALDQQHAHHPPVRPHQQPLRDHPAALGQVQVQLPCPVDFDLRQRHPHRRPHLVD